MIRRKLALAAGLFCWLLFAGWGPSGLVDNPVPVLAYYYIWFDHSSWDRAKIDYPLLGRYSSDDRNVMEQHVRWAQAAGIDGFIVSWKSTDVLNPRLEQLMEVAREAGFKLVIIYQGLDFERDPLPVNRVSEDLGYFTETYAEDEVFDLFNRPVVIWSGTWRFTTDEIASVASRHEESLSILASERNLEGYERLARHVDGNAYYWSSVNPDTYPDYLGKLTEMGAAAHRDGGLWIAPAAPGFDARLIGGTRVVERKDGETLRIQLQTALGSMPDAVGLISWNEFSENSHIEPSETWGNFYLEVVANFNELSPPPVIEFDSDGGLEAEPQPMPDEEPGGPSLPLIAALVGGVLLGLLALISRWLPRGGGN